MNLSDWWIQNLTPIRNKQTGPLPVSFLFHSNWSINVRIQCDVIAVVGNLTTVLHSIACFKVTGETWNRHLHKQIITWILLFHKELHNERMTSLLSETCICHSICLPTWYMVPFLLGHLHVLEKNDTDRVNWSDQRSWNLVDSTSYARNLPPCIFCLNCQQRR